MFVNARKGLHIGLGFQSCRAGARELYAVAVFACVCHPFREGPAGGTGRYGAALGAPGYARFAAVKVRLGRERRIQMCLLDCPFELVDAFGTPPNVGAGGGGTPYDPGR